MLLDLVYIALLFMLNVIGGFGDPHYIVQVWCCQGKDGFGVGTPNTATGKKGLDWSIWKAQYWKDHTFKCTSVEQVWHFVVLHHLHGSVRKKKLSSCSFGCYRWHNGNKLHIFVSMLWKQNYTKTLTATDTMRILIFVILWSMKRQWSLVSFFQSTLASK